MWASIILIIIYTLKLGTVLAKHGEQMKGYYHFGYSFIAYIVIMILMYYAGTFDKLFNI